MSFQIVKGNLINLALKGHFNVIAHGCNCFCQMKRGIAPQMAKAFRCDEYPLESYAGSVGDIKKLGNIDYVTANRLTIVNAYTQYHWAENILEPGKKHIVDYVAMALCFKKIGHTFKDQVIGLPKIGAGLAGGNWNTIEQMMKMYIADHATLIVVDYDNSKTFNP